VNSLTPEQALGKAIRCLREESDFSQESLGFACDLHRNYIGSIERGERNVSIRNITVIAKSLGITASELLKKAKL